VPAPKDTIRDFVAAINSHDVQCIVGLCSAQHRFVDSLGAVLTGHENLRDAWTAYFSMFPDYTITVDSVVESNSLVLLSGWAAGTLQTAGVAAGATWRIPAAWRAEVRGNLIDSWQVFADNKPVYELLQRDV
jgi:ketosteroid isomerase-like protein